ncbi:hypothetical protein LTR97_006986 [Elasticomyces elasticus]|uniref:Uncharacterized protein n=1 Tax=Elasticomyces elasticus TaxID=574655 RepID=A0AAN7WFF3_9PEZI|nr:hypothetical protein LTR97_006986 [Elasticomyces elasticus]
MHNLLQLPVELRLQIYQYALMEDEPLDMMACMNSNKPLDQARCLQRFDPEVQDDILPMFWSCNTFALHVKHSTSIKTMRQVLSAWVEFLARDVPQYLRRVQMHIQTFCASGPSGPEHPQFCKFIVDVDLDREHGATGSIQLPGSCPHGERVEAGLDRILAEASHANGRLQMDAALLTNLFDICTVSRSCWQ